MSALSHLVLIGWLGVGYVAFRRGHGPRAVLAVFLLGLLFLPEIQGQEVEGVPPPIRLPIIRFTKTNVICYAALLGSLVWDRGRWARVKPRWADLPMLLWTSSALISSLVIHDSLSQGAYEGGQVLLSHLMVWTVPYWMGRLYFGSRRHLLILAAAIVVGGIVYWPLCHLEMRLSPQLHRWVYGFHQHDFIQTMRDSGFRPMVFLEHGLMVAFFMVAATLAAFWLWHENAVRTVKIPRLGSVSMLWPILALALTLPLMHSTGAFFLGLVGLAILLLSKWFRSPYPLLFLLIIPPVYVGARYSEVWTGQSLVDLSAKYISKDRAQSLGYRFKNEYRLLDRAHEEPIFGWGDSGLSRVVELTEQGQLVVTDSLWIIVVGTRGLYGLITMMLALQLPVALYLWHFPPRRWRDPLDAAPAVLAVILALHMIDHLFNAMINPIYLIAAGGLVSLCTGDASAVSAEPEDEPPAP